MRTPSLHLRRSWMVETYTEFVADGQTALRVWSEYMDIYIYTNMPGAAVCPCVSLVKPETGPPGQQRRAIVTAPSDSMFKVQVPQGLSSEGTGSRPSLFDHTKWCSWRDRLEIKRASEKVQLLILVNLRLQRT